MAARKTQAVARPLKVLVPLIKEELDAADEAGLGHYRRAGEMLLEAREQLSGGSWTAWLTKNFALSRVSAWRYMKLAEQGPTKRFTRETTLADAIGERPSEYHRRVGEWRPLREITAKVNVDHLAQERQTREDEVRMHRELAVELIEIGFKALATRLHPDKGGSKDAMVRLNRVRHELKDVATTRRFV
jgi:hypothetical protein